MRFEEFYERTIVVSKDFLDYKAELEEFNKKVGVPFLKRVVVGLSPERAVKVLLRKLNNRSIPVYGNITANGNYMTGVRVYSEHYGLIFQITFTQEDLFFSNEIEIPEMDKTYYEEMRSELKNLQEYCREVHSTVRKKITSTKLGI